MDIEIIERRPEAPRFATPLLFVHGTGHGAWCWDEHFLPFFAGRGFVAAALSLRGHGGSGGGLRGASIADYVADVERVAAGFPVAPVVVGHSMGGLVVQKYLERNPAPAAVLVAPSPSEGMLRSSFSLPFRYPLLFAKIGFRRDYSLMFSSVELAKRFLFSADADDSEIARHVERFGPESYRANLEMIYNRPDVARIKTRMLVVGAADDALVSARAIRRTAADYGADLRIFERTAHDMMLDVRWLPVAEHIAGWLESAVI